MLNAQETMIRIMFVANLLLLFTSSSVLASPLKQSREEYRPSQESLRIVNRILDDHPVIDGHNDFVMGVRSLLQNDLSKFNFNSNLSAVSPFNSYSMDHTDLPRLRKGRVGGQFWSSYVGCSHQHLDAVQQFMEQIDVIKRLVQAYSDDLVFVESASELEEALKGPRIASLIGVESGHALGSSLGILRMLYELGARYLTLTHNCNTPWADANVVESGDEEIRSDGLSEFGVNVVQEMNRLGMLVDLSHVSTATMEDALKVSKAPVIFSHSSARTITDVPRNVPDHVLKKVKENGGVVMVNFYSCFVVDDCSNNKGSILDVVDHINHIRSVAGVDHIGLGADYCGTSSFPNGLSDSSSYPLLLAALLEDKQFDWSASDLAKVASANLVRVFKDAERVRDELKQKGPLQQWMPMQDLLFKERICLA